MKIKICAAYAGEDEIVAGYNPENSEPGNPNGAYYARGLVVTAETVEGRRFNHHNVFDVEDDDLVNRLVKRVNAAGEIDLAHWNETYEIYGSAAWEAEDKHRQRLHEVSPMAGTVRDY